VLFLSNKIKVTHLISDTIRRECYGGGDQEVLMFWKVMTLAILIS